MGDALMVDAAQFCLEWLAENKEKQYLITVTSTSPENIFITPTGYKGATLYGATADLAMIRELFQQTIQASAILNLDIAFRAKLEVALSRLHPYQIGKKGNLQEWYHDWEDEDPKHRHQTHLFGLYPGHHISPESKTLDLANACRKTLEIKGDETTGWSKGQVSGLCARGGFEISLQWINHKLHKINVLAKKGGKTILTYGDVSINIDLKIGKSIEIVW